ncbi:MAG: hypothetical protein K2H67_05870 [Treponemataceae bacterium]|nr:hypothetical protein [Treponemataceae bacterium]
MNRKFFIAIFAFCAIAAAFAFAHGAFAQEHKATGKYKIGDKGPGGGIVFYYSEEGFPVQDSDDVPPVICHYLECSSEELGEMALCPCRWKRGWCYVNTTDGVGAGKLNTALITSYKHQELLRPSNCAAEACSQYSTNMTKKGEWYLPSKTELDLIYKNLVKMGIINNKVRHWSSSKDHYESVWSQDFSNGEQYDDGLSNEGIGFVVRAVRAF